MRLIVVGAMAVFAVASFGWGWGFRRIAGMAKGAWAVTLALGLGAVVFLGGSLNALDLAFAPELAAIVLGGLVLAVIAFWLNRPGAAGWRERFAAERSGILAVAIPAAAILVFTVATQLPPDAYSYADDFGKYFFHPLWMLHDGNLSGSPLSDLGSETLGGKALLDGFVVALFPIVFINATDAVFGLFLCLVLAGSFAGLRRETAAASALAVLTAIFIEPQYINISALYLGAALMLAAVALTTGEKAPPAAMGLLYAALLALKTTFAVFVALHGVLVAVLLAVHFRSLWRGLRWGLIAAGFLLLFLSPWIVLHAPHYLAGLGASPLPDAGEGDLGSFNFFSVAPLFYGSTLCQFTAVALAAFAAAAFVFRLSRGADAELRLSGAMTLAAGIVCLAGYGLMTFVGGHLLAGYEDAVRYSTPLFIGTVPAVSGLFARHLARSGLKPQWKRWLPLAAALPLLVFAPSLAVRAEEAWDDGHILAFTAFARTPYYRDFNRQVLDGPMPQQVSLWQSMVPQGEPLYAWINAPFYLDLDRNPVMAIDTAGLATPWAKLPRQGFVIDEYGGFASPVMARDEAHPNALGRHERTIAVMKLRTARRLRELARAGSVIYDDGHVAIFQLPGPFE